LHVDIGAGEGLAAVEGVVEWRAFPGFPLLHAVLFSVTDSQAILHTVLADRRIADKANAEESLHGEEEKKDQRRSFKQA
jgi:hypothetical protein